MTWQWDYYTRAWWFQSNDGLWRINRNKSKRPNKPPYNLSFEGEHIRSGTLEQLKEYVEHRRYGPMADSLQD